jgi:hypothetical protein
MGVTGQQEILTPPEQLISQRGIGGLVSALFVEFFRLIIIWYLHFPPTDTLCFDNSFSWTRNKRIYYSAEVMCADDSQITTEINSLIEQGDWETLSQKYETTHL